jgi:membrane protein YqaA with SNARE-associated domain
MCGRDPASAILDVLGLVIGGVAAYCLGRAVDARRQRVGFLWAGRALALAGSDL